MWANIAKSIVLTFVVSACSLVLSFLVALLLPGHVTLAIILYSVAFLASLVAYVLVAKRWLSNQKSWFLDLASVSLIPIVVGLPIPGGSGHPPYAPTVTLYNAYLSPFVALSRHFQTPILTHPSVVLIEVLLPPFLMWVGLTWKRQSKQ